MKNLIFILGFILLLFGCSKKDAIVPKEYQGNWIGEEKVLVFTYKHYLNINDHGSGNYKSEGTFGKDYSGTVTLNGSELKISRHTFNVEQAPTLQAPASYIDSTDKYEMILDGITFKR